MVAPSRRSVNLFTNTKRQVKTILNSTKNKRDMGMVARVLCLFIAIVFAPMLATASFTVNIGNKISISFDEATGLESETQSVESRHSNSPIFYPIKMPGLGSVGNITFSGGTFENSETFWSFYNQIKMNTIDRTTMIIHGPGGITWTLNNAWPTSIHGTNLKHNGGQVTISSMTVAYEQLTISDPPE